MFGEHNLTSDAEGEDSEELLTARRKVIQEAYAANERIKKEYPRGIMYKQSDAVNGFLWGLFGSKCLSDEPTIANNATVKEPKPAEPTANYVRVDYHGADTAASTIADDCQSQPVTDCHDFDRIVKDGFRGHNRLHIAAMAMQGILANSHQGMVDMKIDKVAELAIAAADKLIAECEKGGEA